MASQWGVIQWPVNVYVCKTLPCVRVSLYLFYPQPINYAPFQMTFNPWQKSSTVTPDWPLWNVQFWSLPFMPLHPITPFLFKLFCAPCLLWLNFNPLLHWGLFHLVPLGTRMLIHFDFCIKDCSLIHISILVQSFYSLLFNVTFYFSNALRSFSRSHCWSSLYLFFFSCRPFHSHFSCFDSLICLKNIYLTFPFCAGWPTPTRTDNTCTH